MHKMNYLETHGAKIAALGYPIIPIRVDRNNPAVHLKDPRVKGWPQFESTPENIKQWVIEYPNAGIGLKMGRVIAADLDIMDERLADEMRFYFELLGAEAWRIGQAPKATTFFRVEEPMKKVSSNKYRRRDNPDVTAQIEILGQGQQSVIYGVHPKTGKPYEWDWGKLIETPFDELPLITPEKIQAAINYFEDLIDGDKWELVTKAKKPNTPITDGLAPELRAFSNHVSPLDISLEQIKDALEVIEERSHDYDDWLKTGMALYHQFEGDNEGFALWDDWSALSPSYGDGETWKKWKGFEVNLQQTRPVTFATVLHWAKEINDSKPILSNKAYSHVSAFAANAGHTDWLMDGLMERDTTGVLFGEPGCFKSFLALDWALCVASGTPFQGHPVKQGTVAYIAGEGVNGLAKRCLAWCAARGLNLDDLPLYMTEKSIPLGDKNAAKETRECTKELTPDGDFVKLVVIDTVARNYGSGDENSTADMGKFTDAVDREIRQPLGTTVLLVHHTGHSNKDRMRGSNSLIAASDFIFRMEKMSDSSAKLTNTRQKNVEPQAPIWMDTKPIVFEHNGLDLDSLVLVGTAEPIPERPKLSEPRQKLYDLIEREGPNLERATLNNIAVSEGIYANENGIRSALSVLTRNGYIQEYGNKYSVLEEF